MPISNFDNGFAQGVTIRGLPITQTHPGKVYHVNNSSVLAPGGIAGSNGNAGTYTQPFSTIDYAIGRCQASAGDIIMVMPGHAETISDASTITMDVAGIAIVGLGVGSLRPTLTFDTATSANIPVTAANMSISNFLIVNNFADIASNFTATGTATPTDLTIENCEFRDTSSILNALTVLTDNATDNALDGLAFLNNRVSSLGTTAATTTIVLASVANRMQIKDNFTVHAVLNDTPALIEMNSENCLNFELSSNVGTRPNTSSTGGSFVGSPGTCTGMCTDNKFYQLDASAGIWIATSSGLGFIENYSPVTGAADKSALINPVAV